MYSGIVGVVVWYCHGIMADIVTTYVNVNTHSGGRGGYSSIHSQTEGCCFHASRAHPRNRVSRVALHA